jgi:photosynthetic reaction center cytochrome c subunit
MHLRSWIVCGAAAVLIVAAGQSRAEPAKTAEEVFKNIQALKGTPADQLIPAMQFIAASLGVECEFCHVAGRFDSDDKRPKQIARKMIAMTLAINKDDFNGRTEVSCYSCHRGANDPVGTPPVATGDSRPEHAGSAAPAAGDMPAVGQVLEKYVAALGGAAAIRKVTSRVEKGTISFAGHASPIEVFAKAPDKRMSLMRTPNGDSITAFDGSAGWLGNTGRPPREMSGAEVEAAKLDADFYFAVDLKTLFSRFRMGRPEEIGGKTAYTVFALREGWPPVRLYFDETSGLLVRLIRYADTPVGRNPTQIDYADYREVDGVKVPFRWTLARPGGRFTIQIEEARQNVPVDDAKFAKPVSAGGSGQAPSGH